MRRRKGEKYHPEKLLFILAVVFLTAIKVGGKPVLNLEIALTEGVNRNVIFLVASCVLMGAAVTNESMGLNQFILTVIEPVTKELPPSIEHLLSYNNKEKISILTKLLLML